MIVSNTSPLINFAAIDRLDILQKLFGDITIPKAVERELLERGTFYPSASVIRTSTFIHCVEIKGHAFSSTLSRNLEDGEAEAITLALDHQAELILLDELAARQIARVHNLKYTGTIGCLIDAKKSDIITLVKPLLDDMIERARFWISEQLYQKTVGICGEI